MSMIANPFQCVCLNYVFNMIIAGSSEEGAWDNANDYYRMAKFKSPESHLCNNIATCRASKGQWWKFELCNTSATSKASKAKWNFELLAKSLVWYPRVRSWDNADIDAWWRIIESVWVWTRSWSIDQSTSPSWDQESQWKQGKSQITENLQLMSDKWSGREKW